jgi:hypothetical protein
MCLTVETTISSAERRLSPLVPASGPRSGVAVVIPTPLWPVSKFVRRPGLSRRTPALRARERDERAIRRFVHVEFPAIEKKRERTGRRSSSQTKRDS